MKDMELQKKHKEKAIHWASRVSQAKLWHRLIGRATLCRLERNYRGYARAIDTIVPTLFKEDRDKVKAYADRIEAETELDFYDSIMEYLTDLLEEYLKTEYVPLEDEFETGHQEFIRGDKSGIPSETEPTTP